MPVPSKRWKKIEVQVIKDFGGHPNLNSGATWHQKGDGRHGDWCLEIKSTGKEAFNVSKSVIAKLEKDASAMSRNPLLIINFVKSRRQVCVVPEDAAEVPESPQFVLQDSTKLGPWDNSLVLVFNERRYLVMSGVLAKLRLRLA